MNVIDQNSAVISLEEALVPGPSLIDGRTERDRLSFLSEFASLINFYDGTNSVNGNWTPFLLKDPVFLLASISKTEFRKWHSLYLATCQKIEQMPALTMDSTDLGASFNQLLDQYTRIYMKIERWTYFMQRSDDKYDLKSYVIHKVETAFSAYFWALISLRENLFLSNVLNGVEPVKFYLFEAYDELTWQQKKDKSPYWEILGLKENFRENTAADFFKALKAAGDNLFNFFHTIIEHARPEYEKLKAIKSQHPDTTLLRAFVSLLKNHQEQLNGISQKHLEFYYRDILKQSKLFAVPDSTFICAELAKKDAAFQLPAGTLFDAGMDAQKNPIVFATTENITLNPAAITSAYTLSCLPGPDALSSIYFQQIANPGAIQKDEEGNIKRWETFGGSTPPPGTQLKLAIAFASPMLLLREGKREILIKLTFENSASEDLFNNAKYYLSTQSAWFEVAVKFGPELMPLNSVSEKTLLISLSPDQPPIEKFATDPDGVGSSWPMFKIEFSSFAVLSHPPVVKNMKIDVTVSDIYTFQLYNDHGLLSSKTPFQLFGPTAVQHNNFIIGSNEIFSKPFNDFHIKLEWDNLPDDFGAYYSEYNTYLVNEKLVPAPPAASVTTKTISAAASDVKKPSLVKRFINWVSKPFKPKPKTPDIIAVPVVNKINTNILFSNFSFHVDFDLLNENNWIDFKMEKEMQGTGLTPFVPYQTCPECKPALTADDPDENSLLFSVVYEQPNDADALQCILSDKSFFGYSSVAPFLTKVDPAIQNSALTFTDTSSSGFIKMSLSGTRYGFGSEIYPNVVSYIALQNASILKGDTKEFLSPALLPFAPKVKRFSAGYSASQTYDLTLPKEDYPMQCFFYSPFENYVIYDNVNDLPKHSKDIGSSITGTRWSPEGLPLFPCLNYSGVLFLEIENLVPADSIDLYFELSRKYGDSNEVKKIDYYYLSTEGWKSLIVLADGTNNLSCSGVVKLNVPGDAANNSFVMADNKYWFSIAVENDPGSFAQTIFLKTNGFSVQRSGISFLSDTEAPKLPAGTILKTKSPVPQIASVIQPFPSFGGKAAETEMKMNQRVSNRLKTKDRAVSSEDYFRLIRQEFDDIYYSKAIFNPVTKNTEIYVIKAVENAADPNAFLPLVSECTEEKIEKFLNDRASCFSKIQVSNFKMQYVKVKAVVSLKPGFENDGVRKNIIKALNVFLSPWIAANSPQIKIDQGLSDAELGAFLKTIEGVYEVKSVSFQTCIIDLQEETKNKKNIQPAGTQFMPATPSTLFVPYSTHDIQFNPVP